MTLVPDVAKTATPKQTTPAPKATPKSKTDTASATTTALTTEQRIAQRTARTARPVATQPTTNSHRVAQQLNNKAPMKRLNENKGVFWLSKAAEQHNVEALNELGIYFHDKQDFGQAVANFQKSAVRDYAAGQYNLANCYYNGSGVERSNEKAVEYYKRAAGQEYAPAQFRLGNCYYHGEGIEQSDNRAVDWFELACDNGEKQACDMLKVASSKK